MRELYDGYDHPAGTLSETGVLDVGLKCMHSCTFCYYSHWDGSADQFAGMRHAPWRPRAELDATLQNFRDWGLRRFDVTGGEPTLYPELPELMQYAHDELGLRARITTLGQYLGRRMYRSSQLLIERLHAAGVREYLFSLHAVDPELFARITGESLEKLQTAIRLAEALGSTWMTNTVVHAHNATHLPAIARWLAGQNVHLVNFIVMKVEFSWAHARDEAIGRKARYADLLPYLREAVGILVAAGRTVNLRYGPYCAYRGLERHVVGFKSVQLDPYEWRNGLRGGAGDGPYGKPPFLFFERLDDYLREQPRDVETKPGYNMRFGEPCTRCALRAICDGVDRDYVAAHGWGEFEPYPGAPVSDLLHFRRGYAAAFRMPGPRPAATPAASASASAQASVSAEGAA